MSEGAPSPAPSVAPVPAPPLNIAQFRALISRQLRDLVRERAGIQAFFMGSPRCDPARVVTTRNPVAFEPTFSVQVDRLADGHPPYVTLPLGHFLKALEDKSESLANLFGHAEAIEHEGRLAMKTDAALRKYHDTIRTHYDNMRKAKEVKEGVKKEEKENESPAPPAPAKSAEEVLEEESAAKHAMSVLSREQVEQLINGEFVVSAVPYTVLSRATLQASFRAFRDYLTSDTQDERDTHGPMILSNPALFDNIKVIKLAGGTEHVPDVGFEYPSVRLRVQLPKSEKSLAGAQAFYNLETKKVELIAAPIGGDAAKLPQYPLESRLARYMTPAMEGALVLLLDAYLTYVKNLMAREKWPEEIRDDWFPWRFQIGNHVNDLPEKQDDVRRYFISAVYEMAFLHVGDDAVEWIARVVPVEYMKRISDEQLMKWRADAEEDEKQNAETKKEIMDEMFKVDGAEEDTSSSPPPSPPPQPSPDPASRPTAVVAATAIRALEQMSGNSDEKENEMLASVVEAAVTKLEEVDEEEKRRAEFEKWLAARPHFELVPGEEPQDTMYTRHHTFWEFIGEHGHVADFDVKVEKPLDATDPLVLQALDQHRRLAERLRAAEEHARAEEVAEKKKDS